MRPSVRFICFAMLASSLGCHTWQAAPPPQPVSGVQPLADHVRVLTKDGRTLEWHAAVVKGDSVVGFLNSPAGPREAVAIADVASLHVLRLHAVRTAGTTAGVSLVMLAIVMSAVVAIAVGAMLKGV
jgi:hypothetical protein